MSALTVKVLNRAGRFQLVRDDGVVCAHGVARASGSQPGNVTLTFTEVGVAWTPGTPIRVPADWYEVLGAYE